ncbi:hypothetical protein [Sedimentitalea sp.]|uniref:hypothetical protein n=1 Tax=Sedimentitalea sp. TaxID=2048915 RepID=UPI0032992573
MRFTIFTISLLGVAGIANADAPKVPSEAPYIVLSENLDEPNGYGFCIDTYGAGRSDLMQTHTCKPASEGEPRSYEGNDTRFEYDANTMQVASYPFEGFCMQALIATDKSEFALLECNDHPRQKFAFSEADQTLRLNEDNTKCVVVSAETVPAGPWVKRALSLENCDEVDAVLKQWSIVSE